MKREVPQELQKVFDYIDAHQQDAIDDLVRFVQQPSVASQNLGMEECADLVVSIIEKDGLNGKKYPLDGGPAVILGTQESKSSSRCLGAYAHYDVQPPEPIEKWNYPPFGAVIDKGRIWGRGATDNKSGLMSFIKGVKAFRETGIALPVNVKFIFEGEEEIGSPHLGKFVKNNKELFRCDAMHCLDGGMNITVPVPEIDLGLKSILYVELVAHGAKSDVHSLNAPLVPQPAFDLVRALNSLVDENRHILIDDWYDGLWELGVEELDILQDKVNRVDIQQMLDDFGIKEFALGRNAFEALKARAYEPTCNICGITCGYQGAGSKTIVPCEARCKMDFRLPPLIDASKALGKLEKHLKKHGFDNIEVIPMIGDEMEDTYKCSVKEDISQACIRACEMVYGDAPIINGVSQEGTILRHVWMPTVFTGFAQPDCNLHAPNESVTISTYIKGIKFACAIMWEYGKGSN